MSHTVRSAISHPEAGPRQRGGVVLDGVVRRYGAVTALDGLDLSVAPGEFLALVGPSGSGKSTALRMIAGLDEPDTGSVAIAGFDATDLPPKARDIAMVFQAFALYPHLTVFRNLATPLELQRRPRAEIEARVTAAAELLDIAYLLNRKPGLLSGGQRQRVALARALVRDPAVFLFDEPLSHLDQPTRMTLRREILAMHRRSGASTVYVTHDQLEAAAMADRIAVLRRGRLEQVGTPDELHDAPANLFVAGFFGSPMNLVPTTHGESGLAIGALSLPLDAPTDRNLVLGLRPEHLMIAPTPQTIAIAGQVNDVTLAGTSLDVTVAAAGLTLRASLASTQRVRPGDALTLHADIGRACLFDAESGAAVPFQRRALH